MKSLTYAFLLVLCFFSVAYASTPKFHNSKEPIIPVIPEEEEEETTTYTYTPRTRTGITEPDGSTVWTHGGTGVEVAWSGISDALVKLELYHNGAFVCQLCSWVEGLSSFIKHASIPESWGSGSGFQVKLIDDLGNEYWSDEFQIKSSVDISYPNSTSCWSTGTTGTGVAWEGCQGNTVKCEIYRNGNYLDDYSGWISNSGSYERNTSILGSWGSGEGYSIHVMDDQGNEGFSEEFEIGSIRVSLVGNTVEWTGGLGAVKVELYDGDSFVADLSGWIDNTGSFSFQRVRMPSGYTPGPGDCRIRVSDRQDGFGWAGGDQVSYEESLFDSDQEIAISSPFPIQQVATLIPNHASARGDLHGYVTLSILVGSDGFVKEATIVNDPLGLGCGQAAVEAVANWIFYPAMCGNLPVESNTTVLVRFDIE